MDRHATNMYAGEPVPSTSTIFRPGQNDAKRWELLPAKREIDRGGYRSCGGKRHERLIMTK